MNIQAATSPTLKKLPPPQKPTPPDSKADAPPAEKPAGDSVVLKGLTGAARVVLGSAGFVVGGAVGGIKGIVTGAASEPKPAAHAEEAKPSKLRSVLRHAGAAAGLAVGVAVGLTLAPVGLAYVAGTTAAAAIAGAGIGATTPEVLPRMGKAVLGAAKGFKDGGVAGWNVAQKPFNKATEDSPIPLQTEG